MQGISVQKILAVGGSDARGETRELFKGKPGLQVTLYHRHVGAIFAEHFHKGLDPSKDPEYFFLISGQVEVEAVNGNTQERTVFSVNANELVTIEKNIFHRFRALTEAVFLEYRTTVFDSSNADCFSEAEYQPYIDSLKIIS